MELNFRKLGNKDSILIIVHGLYGSSDNWLSVAKKLEDRFTIFIIDQRNHGMSPHSEDHNYNLMADDLLHFMNNHGMDKATILGHSMGGKTAMTFALKNPDRVDKLIIVDIAPKSYGSFSNYALITNDHRKIIDSLLSVNLQEHPSRTSVDNFLRENIPNDMVRSFLLKNITRDESKKLSWKLNISAISKHLDDIMDGFSNVSYSAFPENKTVVVIRGANSPYVLKEDSQQIRHFFPSAQIVDIPDAGHWVHAEQTDLFIKTLMYFIG